AIRPQRLRVLRGAVACCLACLPIVIGFIAPASYLLNASYKYFHTVGAVSELRLRSAFNTGSSAVVASCLTVSCGLVLARSARLVRHHASMNLARLSARVATAGYAVPGTVLALGLMPPITLVEGWADTLRNLFGGSTGGFLLMGTSLALVIAYV